MSMTRVAVVQMNSADDVGANLQAASRWLHEAADVGAQLALLPENFAFMGAAERDKLAHREVPGAGPIQQFLSDTARALKMEIIAGTVPLAVDGDPDRVWPACLHYAADGRCVTRYDKIHLFDVDVDEADGAAARYRESASFAPGEARPVLARSVCGEIGLSICYDLRFPELYRALSAVGATAFTVPAAFTHTTGQAHWALLLRARAVENLCYVMAAAQTGEHPGGRRCYGHSMIIDPWGEVLADCGEAPGYAVAELDLDKLASRRARFPALMHRRLEYT